MPLRILLADDSQVIRQRVTAILEREGLQVMGEAADGCEAVRLARTHRPDVVILDFSMPRLNGLDAARQIILDSPEARVILLTMDTQEHHIVMALRAGVRGYVVKTQIPDELVKGTQVVAGGGLYFSSRVSHVAEVYSVPDRPPRALDCPGAIGPAP
jgi:DNA-binding NarL/FixJ family response regulator